MFLTTQGNVAYVCNQRIIRGFLCRRSYSHHEAKSTHTIVTQLVADLNKLYADSVSSLMVVGTWTLRLKYNRINA